MFKLNPGIFNCVLASNQQNKQPIPGISWAPHEDKPNKFCQDRWDHSQTP